MSRRLVELTKEFGKEYCEESFSTMAVHGFLWRPHYQRQGYLSFDNAQNTLPLIFLNISTALYRSFNLGPIDKNQVSGISPSQMAHRLVLLIEIDCGVLWKRIFVSFHVIIRCEIL